MVNNFKSFEKGFFLKEVEENLERFGINEIEIEKRKKFFLIFLDQFKDILVLILVVFIVLLFLFGEFLDVIVIFFFIILNGILGFIQEYKVERVLEFLKNYIFYKVKVIRDGKLEVIEVKYVIVGDIVVIEEGDRILVDGVLVEGYLLKVDEFILIGEFIVVDKDVYIENKFYMGMYVVKGKGLMRVILIGFNIKMG